MYCNKYSPFGKVVIAGRLMQLPFLVEMAGEVQKLTQEVARLRHGKWLETDSVTPADSSDEVLAISEEIRKLGTPPSEKSPASDQFGKKEVVPRLVPQQHQKTDKKEKEEAPRNKKRRCPISGCAFYGHPP